MIARLVVGVIALVAFGSVAAEEVRYIHTDMLGSVVAVTDEDGSVVERREYEPYGAQLTPAVSNGPSYTGHVQDAVTGLTYMQQRYYDPSLGRFLSVDPVSVDASTGANFSRYWYANNNPYKLRDPDGRFAVNAIGGGIGFVVGGIGGGAVALITSGGDLKQGFAGAAGGAVGGLITGVTLGAGSTLGAAATAGVVGAIMGEGTAQTVENAMDHGSDVGSYDYNGEKLVVAGITGAVGGPMAGLVDEVAGPALNAVQKAAVPGGGMIVVNTAANAAIDKPPTPRVEVRPPERIKDEL